jgi:hypothetical protein
MKKRLRRLLAKRYTWWWCSVCDRRGYSRVEEQIVQSVILHVRRFPDHNKWVHVGGKGGSYWAEVITVEVQQDSLSHP